MIHDYIRKETEGRLYFPPWQRHDKWKPEYKSVFIRSILEGKDIPKIYVYTDPVDWMNQWVLDGGHRTRAIIEFVKGEFSVPLKDGNNYVFKGNTEKEPKKEGRKKSIHQTILLPDNVRSHFLKKSLQVVTYSDISETQSRCIFNELNHQRPMTDAELINSHGSLLVDYLRGMSNTIVDELIKLVPRFKKNNHDYLKHLVAMFSLLERPDVDKFNYCEPKNALRYVRGNGVPDGTKPTNDAQFKPEEMDTLMHRYDENIRRFMMFLEKINESDITNLLDGDAYTLFHFLYEKRSTNEIDPMVEIVVELLKKVAVYKEEETRLNKIMKYHSNHTTETLNQTKQGLDDLCSHTDDYVIDWAKTTKNNPCGPGNMKTRYRILCMRF